MRHIVMTRPIPERLIADLARAPLLEENLIREYSTGKRTLTPALAAVVPLVIEGKPYRVIAKELGITHYSAQDRIKRLLALYRARNRVHLAAMLVREQLRDRLLALPADFSDPQPLEADFSNPQ